MAKSETAAGGITDGEWQWDPESDDGAYDDDPEEAACTLCAGEGLQDCPDPLECTRRHNSLGECACAACGGTGDAKDQTIW